jgi:signal transduction histidine kinase
MAGRESLSDWVYINLVDQNLSSKCKLMYLESVRSPPMNSLKLKQFFCLCLGIGLLWAASVQWAWAGETQTSPSHFSYSVFIDESRKMAIDSVQNQTFQPLVDKNKLDFSGNSVWLKIEQLGAEPDTDIQYLKFLPAFLIEATVYKPNEVDPNQWDSQTYAAQAVSRPLLLGVVQSNSPIYLRLKSEFNFRLNVLVDKQESIELIQRRLDMFVIMISTLMLLAAVFAIVRIVIRFNWVSVGLLSISIALPTSWISAMGMLSFLTGVDQTLVHRIFPVAMTGGILSFFFIWMNLATLLFKDGQFIKYLWVVMAVIFANFIYAFIDPLSAFTVIEVVYKLGQVICIVSLIVQGVVSRDQLRLRSEKILFAALLLFLMMPFPRASNLFKPIVNSFGVEDIPLFFGIIFARSIVPLGIMLLTAWTYDMLVSERVKSLQTKLKNTNDALEKESVRLKQQKQFIGMLTHELKNPLMASAMALSSIRHRLAGDDQSLQRVNAISYSLDEIDGIIERCSEIDKYEQGYIPVTLEPLPLGVILSVVKNSQANERTYTIVKGCDESQVLLTDIYYVKAILNNLLNNAIKYAVPESLIEFKVEAVRQANATDIVFTVLNEVSPEGAPNPEMVFQRYYRSETAKQQSGAGLGLWLAQSMAHALGTEIHYAQQLNNVTFHFAIRA